MSAWKAFYEGREGHDYRKYVKERYAPFIEAITRRLGKPSMALEIGCGTGTITSIIAQTHRCSVDHFCATDVCPEMVQTTKRRMDALGLDVAVFEENALHNLYPTKADVVHSHGMLEHFDDFSIRKIIDNYRHARLQVHYVPGEYEHPTFGDERLLPVKDWWGICQPDQIITFNGGLDYALIFER